MTMSPATNVVPEKAVHLPYIFLLRTVLQSIEKETGPSFQLSQLNLLLTIMDEDGISYPDLMSRTELPASTISRNVKELFKRKLVEIIVDPKDTRCHAAKLTQKGGNLKREIQGILRGDATWMPKR
jgi:DNA-binding MarR family transcriptional regulator